MKAMHPGSQVEGILFREVAPLLSKAEQILAGATIALDDADKGIVKAFVAVDGERLFWDSEGGAR